MAIDWAKVGRGGNNARGEAVDEDLRLRSQAELLIDSRSQRPVGDESE